MKKLIIAVFITIIIVGIVYLKKETIFYKEKIINSFEIPTENQPDCYPVELVDYREVSKNDNELMVFGRTVWSKKIKSDLRGKPVVVPIEIYVMNSQTKEQELVNRGYSNPDDGNIVLIIKNQQGKCKLKIDYKNAENCPEEFKNN